MDGTILKTDTVISPFGDPAREARVLDTPVVEHLEAAMRAAGCASTARADRFEPGTGERLVATDDLWVTRSLVGAFVKQARALGKPAIVALPEGLFTDFTAPLQELGQATAGGTACRTWPLVWLPPGADWSPDADLASASGLTPVLIDLQLQTIEIPMHRVFVAEGVLRVPMTHMAALRVGHWMHIVRANQIAQLAWGAHLFKVEWHRILWAALRAMSVNKWRVMGKLVTRGRNCDIHPSAVVEASTLGDNVTIGANAVVRYSHLGDGVRISDQCNILYSVLGQGVSVARMGMLQSTVLYPGASSGHYGLQLCVVGRDTFVGGEVVLGDFKPEGEVMVSHRGQLVSSGTNMLGCAVGHDCQVLMRATTYAGREIPNGYWILGSPHDIIAKIPPALPSGEPLIADGGVLTPYREVMARRRKAQEQP